MIDGIQYRAHRVIFKLVHGTEPDEIDHINGDRTDNRIANLRASTRRENMRNMECHRKGLCALPPGVARSGKRYIARTYINGKYVYLGTHDTAESANDAINAAIAAADAA